MRLHGARCGVCIEERAFGRDNANRTRGREETSHVLQHIDLLTRHLPDCFGEIDPTRRRAAIDEIFHEDAVYYDHTGAYGGRDEIHRIAGVIKAGHPDYRYQPIAPPEERGNGGRGRWVSGLPGRAPSYAGTDFIISRDGRIAAVYRRRHGLRTS